MHAAVIIRRYAPGRSSAADGIYGRSSAAVSGTGSMLLDFNQMTFATQKRELAKNLVTGFGRNLQRQSCHPGEQCAETRLRIHKNGRPPPPRDGARAYAFRHRSAGCALQRRGPQGRRRVPACPVFSIASCPEFQLRTQPPQAHRSRVPLRLQARIPLRQSGVHRRLSSAAGIRYSLSGSQWLKPRSGAPASRSKREERLSS
jgi:hypothetical protein